MENSTARCCVRSGLNHKHTSSQNTLRIARRVTSREQAGFMNFGADQKGVGSDLRWGFGGGVDN